MSKAFAFAIAFSAAMFVAQGAVLSNDAGMTDAASVTTPVAVEQPVSVTDAVAPAVPAAVATPTSPASAPVTALDNLSSEVMNILVPVFVALIGAIATFLLDWVRRRFKLNVSDKQIDAWQKVSQMAASRAGEWARNKAKEATEGKKVPGPEVLEVAVNWAVEMGKSFKLPEMGREKLAGLIEAQLHTNRTDS